MRSRTFRRFAARLALAAMAASFLLPAHATLMRVVDKGPGGDLCVGGKLVPASPATPAVEHDCKPCCTSTSATPPPAAPASAAATPATQKLPAIDLLPMPSGGVRAALARGPPILL